MIYRIAGGVGITLLGFSMVGEAIIPTFVVAVFLIVGGIALLAGK